MVLPAGTPAPDFTLLAAPGEKVSLSDLDRPTVLIFYPADWSPVCGDELAVFSAAKRLFDDRGAQLLGVSVDSVWSHRAFVADRRLSFSLLADFEPKGETARAYDAYREQDGTTERALFVIDKDHVIRWSMLSHIDVSPGADGALRAVEALA